MVSGELQNRGICEHLYYLANTLGVRDWHGGSYGREVIVQGITLIYSRLTIVTTSVGPEMATACRNTSALLNEKLKLRTQLGHG
jgi:hypothetical protein